MQAERGADKERDRGRGLGQGRKRGGSESSPNISLKTGGANGGAGRLDAADVEGVEGDGGGDGDAEGPSERELREMARRAAVLVRLLQEVRRGLVLGVGVMGSVEGVEGSVPDTVGLVGAGGIDEGGGVVGGVGGGTGVGAGAGGGGAGFS